MKGNQWEVAYYSLCWEDDPRALSLIVHVDGSLKGVAGTPLLLLLL